MSNKKYGILYGSPTGINQRKITRRWSVFHKGDKSRTLKVVSINFSVTFYPLTTLQCTVTQNMLAWV